MREFSGSSVGGILRGKARVLDSPLGLTREQAQQSLYAELTKGLVERLNAVDLREIDLLDSEDRA